MAQATVMIIQSRRLFSKPLELNYFKIMLTFACGDVDTSGRPRTLKLVDARCEIPIITR